LCAALVREELGDAETWKQAGGSAIRFAQTAMACGIGDERDNRPIKEVFGYALDPRFRQLLSQ
jgi:hypothetical protein